MVRVRVRVRARVRARVRVRVMVRLQTLTWRGGAVRGRGGGRLLGLLCNGLSAPRSLLEAPPG